MKTTLTCIKIYKFKHRAKKKKITPKKTIFTKHFRRVYNFFGRETDGQINGKSKQSPEIKRIYQK